MLCFPGALYRGGKEAKFREQLLERAHIEAIIRLPMNLFFATSISPILLILSKKPAKGILFLDACDEYKQKPKQNLIEPEHIEKIKKIYFGFLEKGEEFLIDDKDAEECAAHVYYDDPDFDVCLMPEKHIKKEEEEQETQEERLLEDSKVIFYSLDKMYMGKELLEVMVSKFRELLECEKDYLKAMKEID